KAYKQVNEYNTTKACCMCGHKKKKNPDIREFRCENCNHRLNRDINSSVNIAKKETLLSGSDYVNWDLSHVTYTAKWNYRQSRILLTGYATQNVA
ncbi:zinc ribbon domain-containing protein, partial [Haloplasma contractile]